MPSEREQPDIRTLESRVVYQDSWIRLRQDRIERRDGSRGTYAVVEKPDFALVIPADHPTLAAFALLLLHEKHSG